jgi:hypothetical protein
VLDPVLHLHQLYLQPDQFFFVAFAVELAIAIAIAIATAIAIAIATVTGTVTAIAIWSMLPVCIDGDFVDASPGSYGSIDQGIMDWLIAQVLQQGGWVVAIVVGARLGRQGRWPWLALFLLLPLGLLLGNSVLGGALVFASGFSHRCWAWFSWVVGGAARATGPSIV